VAKYWDLRSKTASTLKTNWPRLSLMMTAVSFFYVKIFLLPHRYHFICLHHHQNLWIECGGVVVVLVKVVVDWNVWLEGK